MVSRSEAWKDLEEEYSRQGHISWGPKAECSKTEKGSSWLQNGEKVERAIFDKYGDARTGLTDPGYFPITGGRSFRFTLSAVRSFSTDFSMGMMSFVEGSKQLALAAAVWAVGRTVTSGTAPLITMICHWLC